MKNRIISSRVFWIFLGFLLIATLSGETIAQSSKEEFVYPKSFEIVADKIHDGGESEIRSRDIYIYLDESVFNYDTIRGIFEDIEQKNCDPPLLGITIFSDRKQLDRLISFNARTVFVDFADTPEGRLAEERYYKNVYPDSSGYFRASYGRNLRYESFDYSPNKDSPETIRTDLKTPNMATTAGSRCIANLL